MAVSTSASDLEVPISPRSSRLFGWFGSSGSTMCSTYMPMYVIANLGFGAFDGKQFPIKNGMRTGNVADISMLEATRKSKQFTVLDSVEKLTS